MNLLCTSYENIWNFISTIMKHVVKIIIVEFKTNAEMCIKVTRYLLQISVENE